MSDISLSSPMSPFPEFPTGRPATNAHAMHRKREGSHIWWWSALDSVIAIISTMGTLVLRHFVHHGHSVQEALAQRLSFKNFLLLSFFVVVWTGIHQLAGLYGPLWGLAKSSIMWRALIASGIGSFYCLVFSIFSNIGPRLLFPFVFSFFIFAAPQSLFVRWALWPVLNRLRKGAARPIRTLVVGSGPLARRLYGLLASPSLGHYDVLGFIDSPGPHTDSAFPVSVVATLAELEGVLMTSAVDEVAIAMPLRSCYDRVQAIIATCQQIGVRVTYHLEPFQHAAGSSQWGERPPKPFLSWRPSSAGEYSLGKRFIDCTGSFLALVFLAPLFAAIALLVKLTSPGPVFFSQERYGLNRQKFRMFKFRTMVPDAEAQQHGLESLNEAQGPVFKIKNDPRVTPIGRFLRRTSLDELPQLLNVLLGDMSLVGPRPLPNRDVARFSDPWLMRRFSVKPGLTGLWQVRGRSNTSFAQWIAYDLEYIDNWSPMMDLKIIAMTIPAVLRGSGAM